MPAPLTDAATLAQRFADFRDKDAFKGWADQLTSFYGWFAAATPDERASVAFQRKLWDDNPVAGVGMGTVKVDAALADPAFRTWLADALSEPLVATTRVEQLQAFRAAFDKRWATYGKRRPVLKCFRVMATAWPAALTTLSDTGRLLRLYAAMFPTRQVGPVAAHVAVMDRFEEVLGPATDIPAIVERQCFAWHLYSTLPEDAGEQIVEPPVVDATPPLVPLPPARRRRGLTGIHGSLSSVLSALEEAREGITRVELVDFLRSEHPGQKDNSLGVMINVLRAELGVLKREGDLYVLTERGAALLESADPQVLAPFILTRILGPDFVVAWLRDHGPTRAADLKRQLRQLNPAWTSDFVAGSILTWLRSFDVVESDVMGVYSLTETGKTWAELVTWKPSGIEDAGDAPEVTPAPITDKPKLKLPSFAEIRARVTAAGYFPPQLVEELHAGLWANPRRHFTVLSGLSGAGKTRLAEAYARALVTEGGAVDETRVFTLPVCPGWTDPSPLLGYVNPIEPDRYVATPFLGFLTRAAENPGQPYVVVLDEMNLSHPEQYLAPLLSAMEREGARLTLRPPSDGEDGVPDELVYPANLAIIGTLNMDETTHGLSDKVLDRAFAIEFWTVDLDAYAWEDKPLPAALRDLARTVLTELMQALAPARLHFGYRTVDDVLGYLVQVEAIGAGSKPAAVLDGVVYQKILPKLRGEDSDAFRRVLKDTREVLHRHGLERCAGKLRTLEDDLRAQGSARYWR